MIEMSGRTLQCVCIRKNNPTYEMVWGDSGSVRYSVRNWDGPVIGRGENIFIRRKSDLCAEIVPSAFFLSERTGNRKGRDLLAPTSCVDAVGRISGRSDRKRGKEEPAEVLEDEETIAWILQCQANDEHTVDEEGKLVGAETETQESAVEQPVPGMDLSIERLRDFEYLTSNLYTIDSSTMIGPEQLNVDDLLNRSMKIDQSTGGPKILIFHTHSQEEFADSIPGDPSTSIVGIGEYLTQLLNADGIETLHDSGVYDIINGKLDRSRAYENAESAVRPVLEANPTIEVAIDLHRDGVNADTHLVTEVNGKPTAKIMYFNGLSRTRTNGDIAYLYNPYIQDNLAFSLQMQIASEQYYPGFARHIYLKAYRYNLHLLPKSLLIEAGAQTNTVEEMKNAMEVLERTLKRVVTE